MNGSSDQQDERYMQRCLELAHEASAALEVPVGAVLVRDGAILGEGRNRCVATGNPLAHAEMEALAAALRTADARRLVGSVMYCSLEPCFMCTGALLHARVARIVFGAHDPKFGACGSLAMLPADQRLNHRCAVQSGLLAETSAALLRAFFARLR
jgi:tRNA(adenine34) deaminase